MTTRRPLLFWFLFIAFLAIGIGWLFYVPYRPDRVFSAIPANASVVSVHRNLASEWDNLLNNPMVLRAAQAAGVPDKDLSDFRNNPVTKEWVTRLVSDQSALAYVPSLGSQQKPALVCASWIGVQSRILRWQMAWLKSRDLIPVKVNEGQLTLWLSRTKFGNTNLRLSLALTEGMVLACISEDPAGVRVLLEAAETYPGRMTVATVKKPDLARAQLKRTPRNWGWIDTHQNLVTYELTVDPEHITLYFNGHIPLPPAPPLGEASGLKTVTELTGATSDLITLLPLSWAHSLIGSESNLLWLNTLRPLFDTQDAPTNALAFVALLDQQHNGRLRGPMGSTLRAFMKGVKTPTLLLGIQVGGGDAADTRVQHAIALLNSQYNLSLVLRPISMENGTVLTLIEESRKNFYGSFEPDECVAYTVLGDWLILSSNASVLKTLVPPAHQGNPAWGSLSRPGPSALGWINLESIAPTVKNAAGVMKLATLFSSSEQSVIIRDTLNQAGIWADVLRVLDQAKFTINARDSEVEARLVIGK
ncbi:MAG: hypothetical protein WCL49_12015 [bacterium]